MTPTYFMQDQVDPATKVAAIQGWRPSRRIGKNPALTAPYGSQAAQEIHQVGGDQKRVARASWNTGVARSGRQHAQEACSPAADVETDMALGYLEVQVRRGKIIDEWEAKFIGNVASLSGHRLLTQNQIDKINELYARYGGKK